MSYDLPNATLRDRRESIRATWYVIGGEVASDATGIREDEPGAATSNVLTAPEVAGPITLWVVLRDARGGASSTRLDVMIQ